MSKSLCCVAFETLYSKLNTVSEPFTIYNYLSFLNETLEGFPKSAPLFITWNKNSNLRGCIGTFALQELLTGVKRFSLTAALKDTRFPPIRSSELENLEVSITLLDSFIPIKHCTDWEIGQHGLKLSIDHKGEYYSGTFLPIVAQEQNWDKETTLYYLLKKADFNVPKDQEITEYYNRGITEGWITLEKYNGIKLEMGYDEFQGIRNQLEE